MSDINFNMRQIGERNYALLESGNAYRAEHPINRYVNIHCAVL